MFLYFKMWVNGFAFIIKNKNEILKIFNIKMNWKSKFIVFNYSL